MRIFPFPLPPPFPLFLSLCLESTTLSTFQEEAKKSPVRRQLLDTTSEKGEEKKGDLQHLEPFL